MENKSNQYNDIKNTIITVLSIALIICGITFYSQNQTHQEISQIKSSLSDRDRKITKYERQIEELKKDVSSLKKKNKKLKKENKKLKGKTTSTKSKKTTSISNKQSTIVYITATGSKYHRSWCSYLRQSKYSISKKNTINQGYTPCSRCSP